MKKTVLAGLSSILFSTGAWAANAPCPAGVTNSSLAAALKQAVSDTKTDSYGTLGFGLNMWATVVAADGRVCAVANSSGNAIQGQWLASRVISAQKAFTAATLSLGSSYGNYAISSANLYTATQPGGTLYGLQHSNPVWSAGAYGDRINSSGAYAGPTDTGTYGGTNDPMLGQVIGGINVFGGGLALYSSPSKKEGGVGVSGDTSCTDHLVAWRTRYNLGLDKLAGVSGPSGDSSRPDNIVFDLTFNNNNAIPPAPPTVPNTVGPFTSAGGWGHPACFGRDNSYSSNVANHLPAVR